MDDVKKDLSQIRAEGSKALSALFAFIKKHKKLFLLFLLLLIGVTAGYYYLGHRQYSDYSLRQSTRIDGIGGSNYTDFQNRIFAYNADGVSYRNDNGDLLWSQSYRMSHPKVEIKEEYLMVYDRGGTGIYLFTRDGKQADITTNLPIVDAKLAADGSFAVLMQNDKVGNLRLYNAKGSIKANGEVHLDSSGYPTGIALSEDGQRLAVSLVNLSGGKLSNHLQVYDFGSDGSEVSNRIVAKYSYDDEMIGSITYLTGSNLLVYLNDKILLYNNDREPKVMKELPVAGKIRSIYYNSSYFGYVLNGDDDKDVGLSVHNFDSKGREMGHANLDMSYRTLELLSNNELVLYGDRNMEIYRLSGQRKFQGQLRSSIQQLIPLSGDQDYIFIRESAIDRIKLR